MPKKTGITEPRKSRIVYKRKLAPAFVEEEFEPEEFTEQDYKEKAQEIVRENPWIKKKVYKTEKTSWREYYEKLLKALEKAKK
jgi:hypothetical protein